MAKKGDSPSESSSSILDDPILGYLREQYHIPALVLVMAFMLAVRLQTFRKFVTDTGIVFSGNDPWYHYRQVAYTVRNWPFTMPFDPWTGYPIGNSNGQFGTLFDQAIATVALIVGLGNPSDQTVRLVMILSPPVIAALTAIPVYFFGKRLKSRMTGVVGAVSLSLIPGVFLSRSLVGVADHNIAEPLMLTTAALALVYAFDRANEDAIVFEVLKEGELSSIKNTLLPAIAAGVAIGMYMWVWPPGLILIGITAVFYALYSGLAVWRNQTPEPVLIVGIVSNTIAGLMLLISFDGMKFSSTIIGPIHVGFAFGAVFGCVFLAVLTRQFEKQDLASYTYPITVAVLAVVSLGLMAVVTPTIFQFIKNNAMRAFGFGQHAGVLTIGEAQPLAKSGGLVPALAYQYGMLFPVAIVGIVMTAVRSVMGLSDDSSAASRLFVVVLCGFLTMMSLTQVRFNYYLAPFVAIFASYGVITIFSRLNITTTSVRNLEAYQWMALIMVVGLVFMPILVVPFSSNTAARGNYHSPGAYTAWDEPLNWMNDNTPKYESLDYYGTYKKGDGNYDYDKDVYGVMSWWDYGHWTTVTAERAPIANPFQQNSRVAAKFLLAENESKAESVVDTLGDDAESKYVLVDWKMVSPNSKFGAPVVWHPNLNQSAMFDAVYQRGQDGSLRYAMTTMKQRYYESMMVRLYYYHGSAASPSNVVVDYEKSTAKSANGGTVSVKTIPASQNGKATPIRKFNSSREMQAFMKQDNSSHAGGVGLHPREKVSALEHYRLVKSSDKSALSSPKYVNSLRKTGKWNKQLKVNDFTRNPAWVKVFERVPGATVKGSGAPPNSTVLAQVQMKDPAQGQKFNYRQFAKTDENGEFTMTVPYSTTGYDKYGPKTGHTNVEVRAVSKYQFYSVQQTLVVDENGNKSVSYRQWKATANISEGQVNGAVDDPVTVTLEEIKQEKNNSTDK